MDSCRSDARVWSDGDGPDTAGEGSGTDAKCGGADSATGLDVTDRKAIVTDAECAAAAATVTSLVGDNTAAEAPGMHGSSDAIGTTDTGTASSALLVATASSALCRRAHFAGDCCDTAPAASIGLAREGEVLADDAAADPATIDTCAAISSVCPSIEVGSTPIDAAVPSPGSEASFGAATGSRLSTGSGAAAPAPIILAAADSGTCTLSGSAEAAATGTMFATSASTRSGRADISCGGAVAGTAAKVTLSGGSGV